MKYAKEAAPMGGKIIAEKPYSPHPGDAYLRVVLVEREDEYTPFVVWVHNMECGGFSHGDYCRTMGQGLEAFNKRGRTLTEAVSIPMAALRSIAELPIHECDDARNQAALEIAVRDAREAIKKAGGE